MTECDHPIRLEGIQVGDDWEGFERKKPIYYCPECKEVWER